MSERLSVRFVDFWPGFDLEDNYFTRLLSKRYTVTTSDDPELLIYSCFGRRHLRYGCTRIFFAGENVRPDFSICDYALSFDHDGPPENYRLPLYALYCAPEDLVKAESFDPAAELAQKEGFCSFVVSNRAAKLRIKFFERLSRYKEVASGGRHLNNVGPIDSKVDFIRRYKFSICFENSAFPGYTTEKLPQAMLARTMPIYWGNPAIADDFNIASFLRLDSVDGIDALIDEIIALDRDDALYCSRMSQPWYPGNVVNEYVDQDNVLDFLGQAVEGGRRPRSLSTRVLDRGRVFGEGYTPRRAVGILKKRLTESIGRSTR